MNERNEWTSKNIPSHQTLESVNGCSLFRHTFFTLEFHAISLVRSVFCQPPASYYTDAQHPSSLPHSKPLVIHSHSYSLSLSFRSLLPPSLAHPPLLLRILIGSFRSSPLSLFNPESRLFEQTYSNNQSCYNSNHPGSRTTSTSVFLFASRGMLLLFLTLHRTA